MLLHSCQHHLSRYHNAGRFCIKKYLYVLLNIIQSIHSIFMLLGGESNSFVQEIANFFHIIDMTWQAAVEFLQ